jgi:hypothetical protein
VTGAPPALLAELAARHRPHLLASEESLPLAADLAALLGTTGLRRGSTVVVEGTVGAGATTLALALAAGASAEGAWIAAVDLPRLGVLAASELGLSTDRLLLVPSSGGRFATVAGALLDACDVVLAFPPPCLEPSLARRLVARARERRAVLVVTAGAAGARLRGTAPAGRRPTGAWAEGVDARLVVVPAFVARGEAALASGGLGPAGLGPAGLGWAGLGEGCGHLQGRLVTVIATRRRSAPPRVQVRLWLPSPEGRIALAGPAPHLVFADMSLAADGALEAAPCELSR